MIDEDEVGLKKSQLCHYWDCGLGEIAGVSRLKSPSGGVKCPGQVVPTTGS